MYSGTVCRLSLIPAALAVQLLCAQEAAPLPQPPQENINRRVFGLLSNHRTADGSAPYQPITIRRKFYIGAMDSVDYPAYALPLFIAGVYQLAGRNPSFGQGMEGYGKRYAGAFADQALGNMMTASVFPSLLRQDPRYFRMGKGSNWARTRYALTRVFQARNNEGQWGFNYSEWLGSTSAVAISNAYYPTDTNNPVSNGRKLAMKVGTHALSHVLREFWPDWQRKFFKRKP